MAPHPTTLTLITLAVIGVLSPTPAGGTIGCLMARQFCLEDSACSQILQVIPRVCGLELVACSTVTVTKCQAALRTLQSFPYFEPTCLCKEPRLDPECNEFREFLFDHPCTTAKVKETDPFPIDALPTCDHAQDVCNNDKQCKQRVVNFQMSCASNQDKCVMTNMASCHDAWQKLRLSPIFGCICPNVLENKKRCDQIFEIVNQNVCIDAQLPDTIRPVFTNIAEAARFWSFWYRNLGRGVGPTNPVGGRVTRTTVDEPRSSTPYYVPSTGVNRTHGERPSSQHDQEVVNLKSTCHLALDACERKATCRTYLDTVKHRCVDSCSRDRCMTAVQEFYRKIQSKFSLDIGFCICKKNGADDQCFRAQSLLHPTCAQTPAQWSQREEDLPSCHSLARKCRKEADCRSRLERYEQACSVDSKTKTCSGPYDACRSAMVDILGTELRTNCACTGTAGDFRELFECIGYQRLFWVNPCVVDAQKDYHLKLGNTGSSVTEWTPTEPVWERTPSPTLPQTRPKPPPRTRKPKPPVQIPNEVDTPTYPRRITTVELPEDAMTPFPPTKRPSYPKMPQRTTRSTRKPRRRTTKKSQSPVTPKTTTPTTLPPRVWSVDRYELIDKNSKIKGKEYCTLEPSGNLPGKQYIREGFEKRLYSDDKEGSKLCSCKGGANLECTMLPEIKKKPCNTGVAFYSHASPFYQAYRGQCLCYSGEFICAKPPKPPTKKKQPAGSVSASPPGVFLYLGFSKIDFNYLKNGRIKLEDKVPLNLEEAEAEVKKYSSTNSQPFHI